MKKLIVLMAALASAACNAEQNTTPSEAPLDEARSLTTAWVEVRRPTDASLLELPARIIGAAGTRARIDMPLRAEVVEVFVQVGDRVEAGAKLVELRVPALVEAAAILAGTKAQLGMHQSRRDRLDELRKQGLVGAGEVFDVESGIGRLSAERRLALATLTAAGIDASERRELLTRGTVILDAPVAGVVAQLDAVPGDVVEPGEGLAQLLGEGRARVAVAFSGALPSDVSLEFVGLDQRSFPLAPTPVATAIEPGLGRTLAWYEAADGRALPHGVRGRVILRGTDAQLLEIPDGALRLHEGRAWVGRRPEGGGAPEPVEVVVLRSVGSSALIRSAGLELGDRVASDAATVLQLGRESEPGGEEP